MKLRHILIPLLVCLITTVEAKPRKQTQSVYVPKYASIVIDAHSGDVLYSENPDRLTYPASLTKMMTLYLIFEALENGKLKINQRLKVSRHACRQGPCKLYLKSGDLISVKDAILALMTKSANDVAVVVAEAMAGSEDKFAQKMTAKARALGLKNTTFKNASGLPNRHQKTCARDMAILSQRLLKDYPRYYRYFETRYFSYRGRKYRNHNALLGKVPGVDGIKTGYIAAAGWNLSASASRGGHRVITVVLGGKSRQWRDRRVSNLIETGFERLKYQKLHFVPQPIHKPYVTYTTYHPQIKPNRELLSITPPAKPNTAIRKEVTPSSKPTTPQPKGPWAVQVGAFRSAKKARDEALAVQKDVPSLKDAEISISAVSNTRGKLYRARLINLNKATAQHACPQIVKAGHSCLAIKTKK